MKSSNPDQQDNRPTPVQLVCRAGGNVPLCREHYRLTLRADEFPRAEPGQFVTIAPPPPAHSPIPSSGAQPFYLRRAFSIAGSRRTAKAVEIDVIYRVVGVATKWLAELREGKPVGVLGPLGRGFPLSPTKPHAWLVAGGVGLPPILWLGEVLASRKKTATAFYGARSADLLPLTVRDSALRAVEGLIPSLCADEFARHGIPALLCTDDGSLGYAGNVMEAIEAYATDNPPPASDLVVYACGPEPMLAALSVWCDRQNIECYVCMEREMACGMGTCQSCVVPVRRESSDDAWAYALCCTDGPVFDASSLEWSQLLRSLSQSP